MKKYMLLGTIALMACSFSVVTANNASPTTKSEKVDVLVIDNLADLQSVIQELSFNTNITIVKAYEPLRDLIEPVGLHFEFIKHAGETAYLLPKNLKNKFHPDYLFNPLKTC